MISRWIPNAVLSVPDKGPAEPPPLGCHVVFVPEAARRYWAYWATGELAGMFATSGEAQSAISRGGEVNSSKETGT